MALANMDIDEDSAAYGCDHYKRKCSIMCPACNQLFPCRVCHDESVFDHQLDRFSVTQVQCSCCLNIQPKAEICLYCGTKFGEYYCEVCSLYDDDPKGQFHCRDCGICRVGGQKNFMHCNSCGLCLPVSFHLQHKCIPEISRGECAICMESLHSSRSPCFVPPCQHLLHYRCFNALLANKKYTCPTCYRSLIDMKQKWEQITMDIEHHYMPLAPDGVHSKITCNDCNKTCITPYHELGLKCKHCSSYNAYKEYHLRRKDADKEPHYLEVINAIRDETMTEENQSLPSNSRTPLEINANPVSETTGLNSRHAGNQGYGTTSETFGEFSVSVGAGEILQSSLTCDDNEEKYVKISDAVVNNLPILYREMAIYSQIDQNNFNHDGN